MPRGDVIIKIYVNFHLEIRILNLIGSNVVIGTIFINIAVLLVYMCTAWVDNFKQIRNK